MALKGITAVLNGLPLGWPGHGDPGGTIVPTSGVERQSYYPRADCGGAPSGPPRTSGTCETCVPRGGAFLAKKLIYGGPNSSLPPYIIVSVG